MSTPRRWRGQAAPIWNATPPAPKQRKYDLVTVVSKTPLEMIVLSDQLEETYTHHVDGRTVFCTGPHGTCWVSHEECGSPKYGGFLAVKFLTTETIWLLRLTAIAVSVEPRLRLLRGQLRGRRLYVWRKNGHELSEMHARLSDRREDLGTLQPCPDVRFAVEHMLAGQDKPKAAREGKWRPLGDALRAAKAREAAASVGDQLGDQAEAGKEVR